MLLLETTMSGCATQKYVNALVKGDNLEVPLASFHKMKQGEMMYLDSLIVRNPSLQYPICVFRLSDNEYEAFLMKCTHQGTELRLFGDVLQCSAHGSEFDKNGNVTTGPASQKLRRFPITIENEKLMISLK